MRSVNREEDSGLFGGRRDRHASAALHRTSEARAGAIHNRAQLVFAHCRWRHQLHEKFCCPSADLDRRLQARDEEPPSEPREEPVWGRRRVTRETAAGDCRGALIHPKRL